MFFERLYTIYIEVPEFTIYIELSELHLRRAMNLSDGILMRYQMTKNSAIGIVKDFAGCGAGGGLFGVKELPDEEVTRCSHIGGGRVPFRGSRTSLVVT